MLSQKKQQALLSAGFDPEELQRILEAMAADATDSGRERKERTLAIIGGRSFVADVVNRLLSGESFRDTN